MDRVFCVVNVNYKVTKRPFMLKEKRGKNEARSPTLSSQTSGIPVL